MNNGSANFPIELQNVTRRFGKQLAVNDVSFHVERGKTFGFIGLNGAGKTTAIRMMVGLLAPHGGSVKVAGFEVPIRREAMKSRIGYVPDRPTVYPWMRVQQAVEFVRSFYGARWNQTRCDELSKLFDLDPRKRAKHLSKGQAAKLSMLLAICHDPEVLILDEPTSGLDPLVREEFLEGVLAVTSDRQQTVLFSSHTLADVQRLADNVGLMHEGRLLINAPIDELLDRTKRICAVLEETTGNRTAPPGMIFQKIIGREWTITVKDFQPDQIEFVKTKNRISHIDVQDMSLDDVFKDFVRGQKEVTA